MGGGPVRPSGARRGFSPVRRVFPTVQRGSGSRGRIVGGASPAARVPTPPGAPECGPRPRGVRPNAGPAGLRSAAKGHPVPVRMPTLMGPPTLHAAGFAPGASAPRRFFPRLGPHLRPVGRRPPVPRPVTGAHASGRCGVARLLTRCALGAAALGPEPDAAARGAARSPQSDAPSRGARAVARHCLMPVSVCSHPMGRNCTLSVVQLRNEILFRASLRSVVAFRGLHLRRPALGDWPQGFHERMLPENGNTRRGCLLYAPARLCKA